MKSNTVQILTTVLINVAVLAGLVCLIFELRQNSAIALSEIRQERNLNMTDHGLANARNEKFSGLLGKLTVACTFDEITELEWYQLLQYEKGMKARITDVWFQYEQGFMDNLAYKNSLRYAANSESLWTFLGISPFPQPSFVEDLETLKSSDDFQHSRFATKFTQWADGKKTLAQY